jgi:hypothetical protein
MPRGLVRRLRELVMAVARAVGGAARHETRRGRLGWLAVAALLVLGPLGFNLAREPRFDASMTISPRAVGPYPAIDDPGYYRTLLADPQLRARTKADGGEAVGGDDDVTILPGPEPETVTLTVRAGTPERAQVFVNALGPQIARATERALALVASEDAARLRERLRRTGLSVAERRTLRARLRRIEELSADSPPGVVLGSAAMPQIDRWADRLADALPGALPARPNPAWAALAGLFVAAALWAISRLLRAPASGLLSIGLWRRASR